MKDSISPSSKSWTLLDEISLADAQFMLSDFCIDYLPKYPQLVEDIQNASTVDAMRKIIRNLQQITQKEHKDLATQLFALVQNINQTA